MDLHRLVAQRGGDEHRLRAAPPGRVLPRTVAAEEPQDRHRDPVLAVVRDPVVLVEDLRPGVGPALHVARAEVQLVRLAERELRALAVDVGRRGQHDPGPGGAAASRTDSVVWALLVSVSSAPP